MDELEMATRAITAGSRLPMLRIVTNALRSRLQMDGLNEVLSVTLLTLYLERTHAAEPAQIADASHIPRQTMTSALDGLEQRGYVGRSDHPTDRRRKIVQLTDAGVAMAAKILRQAIDFEKQVMSIFTKDELSVFDSFTKRITDRIAELDGENDR